MKKARDDLYNIDERISECLENKCQRWRLPSLKMHRTDLWLDYMELKYRHEGLI